MRGLYGGYSVSGWGDAVLSGPRTAGDGFGRGTQILPHRGKRRSHPGGQPGQHGRQKNDPRLKGGGGQPGIPRGAVGGRQDAPPAGKAPQLRSGGGRCGRAAAGGDRKHLPGPHLRASGADDGALAGDAGAHRRALAGAFELLRAQGGGGDAPGLHGGAGGHPGRRRPGGFLPVDRPAAGGAGVWAV